MICCDMCGKHIEKSTKQYAVKVEYYRNFDWVFKEYTMCKRCSEKINKFIAFERMRNNKRRREDE